MKIKKFCIIFFLCLFSASVYAQDKQFSWDYWHNGEVNLFNGESYQGKIKYDWEKNSVQLQLAKGNIQSFNALKVESFFIYDELLKTARDFYTLPFGKVGYNTPYFFELLTEGHLDLLNRDVVTQRYVSDPWYGRVGMWTSVVFEVIDSYYFLTKEGVVIKYDHDKDNLLALMSDRSKDIQTFINDKKLSTARRDHLLRIVEYYNSFYPKNE
ncbi:MAG: hypothetical protein EAZ97_08175 [Bacteroidetes bacterium]|nr:MAG: hypothetical protein EAZ97_08175 [Bacteroidota bacterium]